MPSPSLNQPQHPPALDHISDGHEVTEYSRHDVESSFWSHQAFCTAAHLVAGFSAGYQIEVGHDEECTQDRWDAICPHGPVAHATANTDVLAYPLEVKRTLAENFAVYACAGPIAVELAFPNEPTHGAVAMKGVARWKLLHHYSEVEVEGVLQHAMERSQRLVRRYWPAILNLAQLLHQWGNLQAHIIEFAIRSVMKPEELEFLTIPPMDKVGYEPGKSEGHLADSREYLAT